MSERRSSSGRDRRDSRSRESDKAQKVRNVRKYRQETLSKVRSARPKRTRDHQWFKCPLKYENTLPDVPTGGKFLRFPFDEDRFYRCHTHVGSAVEQQYTFGLHTEVDLDVPIDLIDPQIYMAPPDSERPEMHPLDKEITSRKYAHAAVASSAPVITASDLDVDFIVSTKLVSSDLYESSLKLGSKVDPEADLRRINRSFEDVQREIRSEGVSRLDRVKRSFAAVADDVVLKHSSRSDLHATSFWSVLPDEDRWGSHLILTTFDADPDDKEIRQKRRQEALDGDTKRQRLAEALVRADPEASREGLVGTFSLPDPADIGKPDGARLRHVADYDMRITRLADEGPGEHIALLWNDESREVSYVDVKSRVALTKVKGASASRKPLVIKRREMTQEEKWDLEEERAVLGGGDPSAEIARIHGERAAAKEAQLEARLRTLEGAPKSSGAQESKGVEEEEPNDVDVYVPKDTAAEAGDQPQTEPASSTAASGAAEDLFDEDADDSEDEL